MNSIEMLNKLKELREKIRDEDSYIYELIQVFIDEIESNVESLKHSS